LLLFAIMLTAAERFFCPALEVISDFLQLPPALAGATLLAFGNGAPDVFTQLAAAEQVGRVQWVCMSQPSRRLLTPHHVTF
jgi:Ca2+/Na+ antiporter